MTNHPAQNAYYQNMVGQQAQAHQQSAYQQYANQGMAANTQGLYNSIQASLQAQQGQQYNFNRQTYHWVFNGKPVSITEFADLVYGDTAERTMFLLKYSTKET